MKKLIENSISIVIKLDIQKWIDRIAKILYFHNKGGKIYEKDNLFLYEFVTYFHFMFGSNLCL